MFHRIRPGALVAAILTLSAVQVVADSSIVMPNSFRAYRLDAVGSLELEPDWTAAARANLDEAIAKILDGAEGFDIRDYPTLSDDEKAIVEEHVALFEANALAAVEMIAFAGVDEKKNNPEYSVGPGLAFLAERGIADRAILLTGSQQWSTGGRMFMMVLAAAAGAYVPGGSSGLLLGYVDLQTGDIEWMNYMNPITGGDVREAEKTEGILRKLTQDYPDGRLYSLKNP